MRSATASQVALSSMSPPSTDCSASIECGGTRTASVAGFSRFLREKAASVPRSSGSATCGPDVALLFRDDVNDQVDDDVGVQVQAHGVLADIADQAARQVDFRAL